MTAPGPVGIVLAAGASRRFGRDKLQEPINGVPMAVACVATWRAALPRVIVVVSKLGELAAQLRDAGAEVCVCARSSNGMGASLACGIRASADATGWLVGLADMPFLRAATIVEIARALRDGAPLAAPIYRNRRGHPVGFAAVFAPQLLQLDTDVGPRDLLARRASDLSLIPTEDAGTLIDIDTEGDLGRLAPQNDWPRR